MKYLIHLILFTLLFQINACKDSEPVVDDSTSPVVNEPTTSTSEEIPPLEEPTAERIAPRGDFDYTREIEWHELDLLNKKQLQLMRNEIFASYGYKFKNDSLANHFAMMGYPARYDDVTDRLNEIDNENVRKIREVEENYSLSDEPIKLSDFTFEDDISDDLKSYLAQLLSDLYTNNQAGIQAAVHPKFEIDYLRANFTYREDDNDDEKVLYVIRPCTGEECRYCTENVLKQGDISDIYTMAKIWENNSPEAVRSGAAIEFYIVKLADGTYKVSCHFAAG